MLEARDEPGANPGEKDMDPVQLLRQRAQARLTGRVSGDAEIIENFSPEALRESLHELRVHQIELEMQNEELRAKEAELDAQRARYVDLFDGAPIGYCVLSDAGVLLQANGNAARLLGLKPSRAPRPRFTRFIAREDQDAYYLFVKQIKASGEAGSCELHLLGPDGNAFWALIDGCVMIDEKGVLALRLAISDIGARKQLELFAAQTRQALDESTAHLRAIVDHMVSGVITINSQGIMESANQAACTIFGYDVGELLGRNVSMLMPEPHHSQHDGFLARFEHTGEARIMGQTRDVKGRRKDGTLFPLNLSVSKVMRAGQAVFIGLTRDMTRERAHEDTIHLLAYFDSLTGLANRLLLRDRLTQIRLSCKRNARYSALLFIDMDNFKPLNDRYGHGMGDLLLVEVAERLKSCVREIDTVARFGGDEFVVLIDELGTHQAQASELAKLVAEKIRARLAQPYFLPTDATGTALTDPVEHRCSASIGVALSMGQESSADEFMQSADIAMYQAKAVGRNNVHVYDSAQHAAQQKQTELRTEMQRALLQNNFVVYYQLQVGADGKPLGAEALVRWNHAQRGLLCPEEFIDTAERSGLILELGDWVLESVCRVLAGWARQAQTKDWTIAFNVSALQFSQSKFVETVLSTLRRTGADAHRLKLELTESMLIEDVDLVIGKMNALKDVGVGFSLDDFGTGYSSLSLLKRLPLDQLKVDQSFVRDLQSNSNSAVIARSIVTLGHSMGMHVIAEGVETEGQRDALAAYGCDAFQGYWFGRPVPIAELMLSNGIGSVAS